MLLCSPAGVSVHVQKKKTLHPVGRKPKRAGSSRPGRRDADRQQVRSAGMFLAQCPRCVFPRASPVPRTPPLDMSLIICCVTVVALELAEAYAGCSRFQAPLLTPKLVFLFLCEAAEDRCLRIVNRQDGEGGASPLSLSVPLSLSLLLSSLRRGQQRGVRPVSVCEGENESERVATLRLGVKREDAC